MRVYELSKILGVPAKKLLEVLDQEGIQVKSHMSVLDDSSVALLQNKFGAQKKPEPKEPEKPAAPVAKPAEPGERVEPPPVAKPVELPKKDD